MNKNAPATGNFIKRLILHFNVDKTIVMKDSIGYNNTDFYIRELLSQMIWGKVEYSKDGEPHFKLIHMDLEFDYSNLPEKDLINYAEFLNKKYKLKTETEEPSDELRKAFNEDLTSKKIKCYAEITDQNNPGFKFKKQFEDMKKRYRVDDKIQQEYGLKVDTRKFEEKILYEKEDMKFSELENDKKIKFRRIFKNSFHKIVLSFFSMISSLRKSKREFCLVLRFFGHNDEEIDEFVYEFNSFCEGSHPRFCGNHGFPLVRFNGKQGTKDFRLQDKKENFSVSFRSHNENNEKLVLETIDRPDKMDLEELRENIEEFYEDENSESVKITTGYNTIFLSIMEKLAQYCSFVILDDHSFFTNNINKGGKLMLIDPYDYETLQIFFDTDLLKHPEKIDVIDIVNKKKLNHNYCINKFLVNVDPRKVISDTNYFISKIEICEANRIQEIKAFGSKEFPIQPLSNNLNLLEEIRKISSDKYLEMTIYPLLHSALNLVDIMRPNDPVPFIANFMLKNKNSLIKLEELVKSHPEKINESESFTKDINNMKFELENQENENDNRMSGFESGRMNNSGLNVVGNLSHH